MSALSEASEHLLGLHEPVMARGDGALAALRQTGRDHFAALGLPHPQLEEWRYTNLAPLAKERFTLPARRAVSRADLEAVACPVFACSLCVFIDGIYDPALSALGAGADLHVESLAALSASELAQSAAGLDTLVDGKLHPFAALNTALLEDAAIVRAPRGTRTAEPLHVVFVSTGAGEVRSPRLFIVAEDDSQVRVIQDHVSLGGESGLTNAVTEVRVGSNAEVDCITLQRDTADGFLVSNLAAQVERSGRFGSSVLTFGGRLVRNDLSVVLAGEGAEARMNGLFVGGGKRLIDNHTLVDHAVPHCTSHELYKGLLGGQSRGVFRGRVLVRPGAQKTWAEQSNPNLLLSRNAEIDTKPQLEIHADDVKCSHGSAIGQLHEEALFYLRSRAIDEHEARGLLTRGFAREVLDALPVEALREGLEATLEASLGEAAQDE
ncbi:MAG: Fe-S cluster assembly protein SufD [Deltaproteobacteria bacterium]|nr:Fe-S cluster assembly protein SufD [Deltaproteobacteria bacterium]MBW2363164.1 Fe-S cluster assembly protein SufD [Deltaproteobacteria bacterium]